MTAVSGAEKEDWALSHGVRFGRWCLSVLLDFGRKTLFGEC